MERLIAALSDRYRIERELGQGGMATVYLAEDLKHKRRVALKVLKPELAAVLGAERFVQEITTTAALQHPHILALFDSGTADGFLFYVMPFIDGETLRAKLDRETQLGLDDAVRIAREVLDALEYAHQQGIVHRDIKPENILLHGGHAMVADFGIALAVSAAAGGRMTETGLSLGTPHYMSPEQATAEKLITARSDVYSLGSVLYEILAGQPPHLGGSAQQIIMKIIAEPVPLVTTLRKSVAPNVETRVLPDLHLSPDGSRLAFSGIRGITEDIWLYTFATSQLDPFTVGGINMYPTWSPDGARLAYCIYPSTGQVVSRPIDRQRPAERLGPGDQCPPSWTADGTTLVLKGGWTLTPPDTIPRRVPGGADGDFGPSVSPDGRWLAYAATRDGTTDVWVRGFRTGSGPWQVSHGGGFDPVWNSDGRSLFFRTDSAIMVATAAVAGAAFQPGPPARVADVSSAVSAVQGRSFDVFPGGQRLVVFESGTGASVEHLILETNIAGRARKAP